MCAKGFLGAQTDASGGKIGIETLDALEIIFLESMDGIVANIELGLPTMRFNNPALSVFTWYIEDVTAYFIDQSVGVG